MYSDVWGCRMLMWEDGYCRGRGGSGDCYGEMEGEDPVRKSFSKMSIQLYNYGEGWVFGRSLITYLDVWMYKNIDLNYHCKQIYQNVESRNYFIYQNVESIYPPVFLSYLLVNRLMGKVASDKCHKWVFKEQTESESNASSYWQSSFDAVSIF